MSGSPGTKAKAQFRAGTTLNGRYELRGVLGAGGTATVYDGFDPVIQRAVAIKVVKPILNARDPEDEARKIERFQREARAAARIDHPNVVTIYDMGVVAETSQPFIVMEKLSGLNLDEELHNRGAMSPRRAFTLFKKSLDALAAGHDQNIVHRDLKPANIFILAPRTAQEDVRLLDFGIALWSGWDSRLSGTGQLFGTARYLAPEYLTDQHVSPALDVYQMGLVLVEMLIGAPVLGDKKPGDCIWAHVHAELDIPQRLLDSSLGNVLLCALARDPTLRFTDARAFRAALARVDPRDIPETSPRDRLARITHDATRAAVDALHIGDTGPMAEELANADLFGEAPTVVNLDGSMLNSWVDDDTPSPDDPPARRASQVIVNAPSTNVQHKLAPPPDTDTFEDVIPTAPPPNPQHPLANLDHDSADFDLNAAQTIPDASLRSPSLASTTPPTLPADPTVPRRQPGEYTATVILSPDLLDDNTPRRWPWLLAILLAIALFALIAWALNTLLTPVPNPEPPPPPPTSTT